MTPEEATELSEKAKRAGMNESEYLRLMIRQKPNDYPEIRLLLKELINEVNHIGHNINQIVKNHNAQFYSAEDKNRLFAYMKKLNRTVDEAVRKIGNQ
jgi:hypothetical protein